jgi:hypothetical protein
VCRSRRPVSEQPRARVRWGWMPRDERRLRACCCQAKSHSGSKGPGPPLVVINQASPRTARLAGHAAPRAGSRPQRLAQGGSAEIHGRRSPAAKDSHSASHCFRFVVPPGLRRKLCLKATFASALAAVYLPYSSKAQRPFDALFPLLSPFILAFRSAQQGFTVPAGIASVSAAVSSNLIASIRYRNHGIVGSR